MNFECDIVSDDKDEEQREMYASNEKIEVSFNHTMEAFIRDHPETYIRCSSNPQPFQYCQHHYLLTWTSDTQSFAPYHVTPYLSNGEANTTIIIHSSYITR